MALRLCVRVSPGRAVLVRPAWPAQGQACTIRARLERTPARFPRRRRDLAAERAVNEKAGKAPYDRVRDTAGLAADAHGSFHPAWIDDRTGKRQIWTASVRAEPR